MAMLVTVVTSVLRSSQNAWDGHDSDHTRLEAAHAVIRHLVRHIRQAERVVAISNPVNKSGRVVVQSPAAQQFVWQRVGNNVNFGVGVPTGLLVEGISELTFVGFKADGVTKTTVPDDIHSIKATVKVQLDRGANREQSVSSWIWLRSW